MRKHLRLAVIFFGSVVTTVAIATFLQTPTYKAETLLLIERRSSQLEAIDIEALLSESVAAASQDFYNTQYEILRSISLADAVIIGEEIEPADLSPPGLPERVLRRGSEPEGEGVARKALISKYRELLQISPVKDSRLVRVSFTSPDPQLSARIANAHARAYMAQRLRLFSQASDSARSFLAATLEELKMKLEVSEDALDRYRHERGIISLDAKENVVVDRLADLNQRWTRAEAERIALESRVRLVQSRDYASLPAVIDNELVQDLRQELARLEAEMLSEAAGFRNRSALFPDLEARVAETQQRLDEEIQRIVDSVESTYRAAKATEEDLRIRLEQQKRAALALKSTAASYSVLEREAEASRALYDSVFQALSEMDMAARLYASDVFVIDWAEPPISASGPNMILNLALGIVLGLGGGIGLALAADSLGSTFRSPEELEQQLGLAHLGSIPDVRTLPYQRGRSEDITALADAAEIPATNEVAHYLQSVTFDAYRTVRTNILLSRAGAPPRTLVFTSATRSEGKTATTLNSAVMFAQAGARVLVIDADLRLPRCHQVLGLESAPGLTEVLTDQIDVDEALCQTPWLWTLPAGTLPPNPAELVGSGRMKDLIQTLGERFDHILVDSAPLLPVPDSLLLSTFADGVVLVVDQQSTHRKQVRAALSRLGHAQAEVLGVVLNRADFRYVDEPRYAYGG